MSNKSAQVMQYVPPTAADLYNLMLRSGTKGPALDFLESALNGGEVSEEMRAAALADLNGDKWLEVPGKHRGLSTRAHDVLLNLISTYNGPKTAKLKMNSVMRIADKFAQQLLDVPPDMGQLLSRMRQVAAGMLWTKETSPALAFVEAAVSGSPVDSSLHAAALADADNYSASAGARMGLSSMGMKALMDLLHSYEVRKAHPIQKMLKVAAKFEKYLGE